MNECAEFDTLEYGFEDTGGSTGKSGNLPEQGLWCAVLNQALTDMLAGSHTAREWLLNDNKDFFTVCSLAGVSPHAMRTTASQMTTVVT